MSPSDASTLGRGDLPEYITEIVVVIISLGLFAFIKLTGEVVNGETTGFDRQLLLMMRNPADLAEPVGPAWLEVIVRDVTALGGVITLGMLTLAVCGYFLLRHKPGMSLFVLLALAGGSLFNSLLKEFFERPRPDLVPHSTAAALSSFRVSLGAARSSGPNTEHCPLVQRRRALRPFYRRAAQASTVIICVSEEVEASVLDTCGSAVRTVVIENAIDEQRFSTVDERTRRTARFQFGLNPTDLTIAVVSRLHPNKRLDRVIAAVGPESGVRMVIAGDGPDRAPIGAARCRATHYVRRLARRARRLVSRLGRPPLQRDHHRRRFPHDRSIGGGFVRMCLGRIRWRCWLPEHPGVWRNPSCAG